MIGIVLVSHSKALALGIRELVMQMTGPDFPIAVAAGVGEDFAEIGTDAVHIAETLKPFCAGDGAVVLMDMGSAVLSAQTALDLLGFEDIAHDNIRLCSAPIVEAAVAAAVQANGGGDLDAVLREAMGALAPKQDQIGDAAPAPAVAPAPAGEGETLAFETEIRNPHGLHARPAANLVRAAGGFSAEATLTNVTGGRGPASARSLTGIALLQARQGDRIRFEITGADAPAARAALEKLAAGHFGEDVAAPEAAPAPPAAADGAPVGASEGIAVGPMIRLDAAFPPVPETGPAATPGEEQARLDRALARVSQDLGAAASHDATGIFAAQALVLQDPAVVAPVAARIAAGEPASSAWRDEIAGLADAYAAMEDDYLRARAADLRDIARRVWRAMAGASGTERIAPEPPAILLVDELLPGDASACDPAHVLGIVARLGSATAHAAIIARSLGIPMVIAGEALDHATLEGRIAALDGGSGELVVDPDPQVADAFAARAAAAQARAATFAAAAQEPAQTRDGRRIEVLANIGNAGDAAAAREGGAEGVGLLRTEFAYLRFTRMPDEDEQAALLHEVIAAAPDGPVVVRTLDVGADKPLSFLDQAAEANPFLGVRGVRLSFRNPDFFASSLRAILRAGRDADLWIMFPMIADPQEMRRAREAVEAAHAALDAAGVPHRWPVKIGMMVEVPAAVLTLERFVPVADFFSIGTNDLTQYVMAAERGNAALADLQEAMHPSVLRAVKLVCNAAGGRHVAVCGDAASDPVAAAAFAGAGVHALSVRPNRAAAVKAMLRAVSVGELAAALEAGLKTDDAAGLRARFAQLAAF